MLHIYIFLFADALAEAAYPVGGGRLSSWRPHPTILAGWEPITDMGGLCYRPITNSVTTILNQPENRPPKAAQPP